jgi:hypothetical protein
MRAMLSINLRKFAALLPSTRTGRAGGPRKVAAAPTKGKAAARETMSALLGFAHYVKTADKGDWVLRPRWVVLAPALSFVLFVFYLSAVIYQYCRDYYFFENEKTQFADMFWYVIPNRIPNTNIVFMPAFINDRIMGARKKQAANLADKHFRKPRNIWDIIWAADAMPHNIEAQFQAAFYLASPDWLDRLENAFTVLDRALPVIIAQPDPAAVRINLAKFINFCSEYDQDHRIVRIAEEYLDNPSLPPEARQDLAIAYADAIFLRGDLAKASKVIEQYKVADRLEGFILSVHIFWENNEHDRALTLLNSRIARSAGGARERLLYTLAKFRWEEKKIEDAAVVIGQIMAQSTDDYKPHVYLYIILEGAGYKERRIKLANQIIDRFGSNEIAMLALGSAAANNGDTVIQERITRTAFENRFLKIANFRLLAIETLVAQKKYEEAVDQISDILVKQPSWLRTNNMAEQFESLRMLAYFSKPDDVNMGIITFEHLLKKRMTVQMYVAIARRLVSLGRPREALLLLKNAYVLYPYNHGVMLELVKLDLKNEAPLELGEHVSRFIELRRPPRYVLRDAFERLGSDRYLFMENREQLLSKMDNMLRTVPFPQTELEKEWPDLTPKAPAIKPVL